MLTDPKKKYRLVIAVGAGDKEGAYVKIMEGPNIYQRGNVRFCLLNELIKMVRDADEDDDLSKIADKFHLKIPPRG